MLLLPQLELIARAKNPEFDGSTESRPTGL